MEQGGRGWLAGPSPFDAAGQPMTGNGHQAVNLAFGFRFSQGDRLRAVGNLKRGKINRAAASHTPVNLPTCGRFAAVRRTFREGDVDRSSATAEADNKAGYNRLRVPDEHKELAAAA